PREIQILDAFELERPVLLDSDFAKQHRKDLFAEPRGAAQLLEADFAPYVFRRHDCDEGAATIDSPFECLRPFVCGLDAIRQSIGPRINAVGDEGAGKLDRECTLQAAVADEGSWRAGQSLLLPVLV